MDLPADLPATAVGIGNTIPRLGTYIGSLIETAHDVQGDVYIASETQIRLTRFEYDGQGPGT